MGYLNVLGRAIVRGLHVHDEMTVQIVADETGAGVVDHIVVDVVIDGIGSQETANGLGEGRLGW